MSEHEQDYLMCLKMEEVRSLRLRLGLSTHDIALSLHVSEKRVREWENSPTPDITLAQWTDYALACGYAPRIVI